MLWSNDGRFYYMVSFLATRTCIPTDTTRKIPPTWCRELFNPGITLEGPIRLKDLTRQATRELQRKIILKALEAQRWNRKRTAEVLSMSYRGLLYKMKEAGL